MNGNDNRKCGGLRRERLTDARMADVLLRPGKIGKLTIQNRFVMTPVNLAYADVDGQVTPQLVEFYRRRAAGGAGLIIVGAIGVDPKRINTAGVMQLSRDRDMEGMRRLVEAIHAEGGKVFPQLWHPGAYAIPAQHHGQTPVAPSSYMCNFSHAMTREMTVEEIQEMIQDFALAARRAKQIGFDGVELVGSAGYLIAQFLSSATNLRTDRYGGDLKKRMTFLKEIVAAVREVTGPDYPLDVRLAGNEFVPNGNDNNCCIEIARELESIGVDAVNITGGWHETLIPQVTMDVPRGAFGYLARRVKREVSIPVFACNRYDLSTAALAVERGDADFIGFCRAFIADPDMVKKLEAGQSDLVRPCIGCNQGCMDHIFIGQPLECLANADAGHELEGRDVTDRKVLVVGAGAAGMEYALRAANAGAEVTVYERSAKPGGQTTLAAAPPGRGGFAELSEYQYRACLEAGVQFEFCHRAKAEEIIACVDRKEYDLVVIATGAQPILPDIPTEEGAAVVSAWDVLRGDVPTGQRVIVIGGGAVGVETALKVAEEGTIDAETLKFLFLYQAEKPETLYELLTRGNKEVSIVEMKSRIGTDIGRSTKWIMMGNLKRYHVATHTDSRVISIQKDSVTVERADGACEEYPADTVILAVGSRPENQLAKQLEGRIPDVICVGDAKSPRKVMDAIHDVREAFTLE